MIKVFNPFLEKGILRIGCKIRCSFCLRNFMEVIKELKTGDQISASNFKYLDGTIPRIGDIQKCFHCGSPFLDFETTPRLDKKTGEVFVFTKP